MMTNDGYRIGGMYEMKVGKRVLLVKFDGRKYIGKGWEVTNLLTHNTVSVSRLSVLRVPRHLDFVIDAFSEEGLSYRCNYGTIVSM